MSQKKTKNSVSFEALSSLDAPVSFWKGIPFGLQHVMAMFVANLAPIFIVANAAKMTSAQSAAVIQSGLLVAGLGTCLQLYGAWLIGSRLPMVTGISFTYVAAAAAICADKGYGAVVGAVIVGGLLELVLGLTARYWRRFVPSIGFSLLTVGATSFGGGDASAADFGAWQNLTLGLISLVACLAFQLLMKGTAKQLSVLFGLVVGYVVAICMGKVDFSGFQELSVVSDGQSVASEQSSRLSERLTALRMEAARLEAERATAKSSAEQLRGLEHAMRGDREQKLQLIDRYTQEAAELEKTLQAEQDKLAGQDAAAQARQEELQAALAERAKVEARKTATEKEVQEKNRDILNMERESARLESRKNAAELEEKQILDRLWDTYELTRSSAPAAAAELESTAAGTKRAAELRKKISGLGTPNLGAIDEFARVNERYEYLCGQRDDVLTSKRDLEGIIGDITGQMTDIFVTEFGRINTYFGQTFTEMFGGGKASLELEDRSQPLTCGIEIRVQPPGKQLKTITLLSGGEKAFVAIALYFAILKVRPTPFCMLDEIDAALDDRNVERFAGYLRGFSGKTQFIVITHRRGTMEAADVLYGVTMQEQGISRILHLDLNQMEQQLGISEEIK